MDERNAATERNKEIIKIAFDVHDENDRLRDELQRSRESPDLAHTVPDDTEIEARRKFLKCCR